jgi:hypothetical protein
MIAIIMWSGIGNEIASAIAFPSATWERGEAEVIR